jgi:hypothetical protein
MKGIEMKHLSPLTQRPQPAESVIRAFLAAKYEAVEQNTNLKDIF